MLEQLADHTFYAVCLALHGGALADGYDDPEGELLEAVRNACGPNVPVVATSDLHANVTPRTVASATGLCGVHSFPHTDQYEPGQEAVDSLTEVQSGAIEPVSALARVGMVVPVSKQLSSLPAGRRINDLAWSIEKPSSANRRRHSSTVGTETPTPLAIATFAAPSAAPSTIRARVTMRCSLVPERTSEPSASTSAGLTTNGGAG